VWWRAAPSAEFSRACGTMEWPKILPERAFLVECNRCECKINLRIPLRSALIRMGDSTCGFKIMLHHCFQAPGYWLL
jgi:hypothetical protein